MSRYGDRYDDHRGRDRGRSRSPPRRGRSPPPRVSLLCRNVGSETSQEDLKRLFNKYGEVKDVYMPVNYYTKERQGFAFIEFYEERDAEYAQRKVDREVLDGRELAVVFAKQKRKRPDDMRRLEDRRRDRSPPRRRSRSRSPRSRSRSPPRRRRSPSPSPKRASRSRSRSRSASRSPRRRSPSRSRSKSKSSDRGSAEASPSPKRDKSQERAPSNDD